MFRTILKLMTALVVISLASTAFAQQPAGVPAPSPAVTPAAPAAPAVPPSATASPQPPQAMTETPGVSASPEGAARALKSTMPGMRELSP